MKRKPLHRTLNELHADKVPRGWYTDDQLARLEGYTSSRGGCFYLLRAAARAGLLEEKTFRVATPRGIHRRRYYRYAKR